MRTVDHRFALSKPALVSAPSKKSFSRTIGLKVSTVLGWGPQECSSLCRFRVMVPIIAVLKNAQAVQQ
jgi:hypothetical protein